MLVGRDRELAELNGALGRVSAGEGALYLLAGEPGIGKSRLAAELAGAARERGLLAAWGRCWEAGGAPAFWPWREACETLGVPFPAASSVTAADPAEARFALFRQVTGALGRAAAGQPLLIVLEDLHAADHSTLLLLEFVAGQLRNLPVLVIGTYRELEASLRPESSDSIARLGRAGQVLHLPRLTGAEVAAVVRETIERADDRLVSTVFETTQGNPLFVAEIVRDIRAHGGRSGLPLGVREIIRQRLALVPADARTALEAGAVLGVEFGAAEVARMVPGATAMLEAAARAGLVTPRGTRLRFCHALYREALYHDLAGARRQALHREAARALAATGAPLAELAHHLLEAGPDAAAEAIDHAVRAARLALDVFAFEDAAALLERARAAIPAGDAETGLRCRVLVAIGEARVRGGDPTGRAACVEAAEIARALGDAALLGLAGLAYGAVFTMLAVDPVLIGMLREALAGLPPDDSALRARVMARLAAARQPSPPPERPRDVELALEAIEVARRVGDRRNLLDVMYAASGALYGAAPPAVRLPISREQERIAEELGDITRRLHAQVRLAIDHLELADLASYQQLIARFEELAGRVGPAAAPWRAPLMRSMCALAADRFDESERWLAESRRIESEHPRARRAQAFHRIGLLRAAERHAELRAAIPELRSLWLAMSYGAMLVEARVASVLARIGADDEVAAILGDLPAEAFAEAINLPSLAEAVWATADAAGAARLDAVLLEQDERWQTYWFDCEIVEAPHARSRAYVAGILGRWDDCDRHFAQALGAVEAFGRRSLAARMRFELGDLFVRAGREPERARALLTDARAEAGGLGLTELVGLIDRRHPSLSAGSAPRPARPTRPAAFRMTLEGEYYALPGTRGTLRFKASRGMRYLAVLVERPGADVHVLELVGSADQADRSDAGELVDPAALRAYRARLEALRDAVDTAEALGDGERAERARSEMEAIAGELGRTTRGGRARRAESAVDRARSAVQRRIKDALDRIAEQDAELGAWLRRSIRTGNYCSYRPDS